MSLYKNYEQIVRPQNIMEEVCFIILEIFPDFDFSQILSIYQDIFKLFNGDFIGYRKCNTRYHDFRHTEDCTLEFARIAHGAFINGQKISKKGLNLGLISALMHDTGYIQRFNDSLGTGGKYTITHVGRSIDFIRRYFFIKGYSSEDFNFCKNCLKCTGLNVNIKEIVFQSEENELMGKILGVADLIGQMADWCYLEKLPFLFEEYHEAQMSEFESELDLLKKTPDFWKFSQNRFKKELGNVDHFLKDHFKERWGIDRDLDREAIEFNITRLTHILEYFPDDYRKYLSRHNLPEQFSLPLPSGVGTVIPQEDHGK